MNISLLNLFNPHSDISTNPLKQNLPPYKNNRPGNVKNIPQTRDSVFIPQKYLRMITGGFPEEMKFCIFFITQ